MKLMSFKKIRRIFQFSWSLTGKALTPKNSIMITVLKSTRQILRLTGLGADSLIVFKKFKIPKKIIQIIIVLSQIYATLPYILYSRGKSYLLERINNPTYAIVGYIGTVLIYIEFIRSILITNEAINFLENIVEKS